MGRIREKGIELVVTEESKEFLIDKGYNPDFGARPLRRSIQRYVEDALAEKLLQGEFPKGSRIEMVVGDDEILFRKIPKDTPKEEDAPAVAP
jgi:ATP-dependent Clp protease ATP-binding subunit ClpA